MGSVRIKRITPKHIANTIKKIMERKPKPIPLDLSCTLGKQLLKFFDDAEMLDALLIKGANVDARDEYGNTALILAAQKGNLDSCRILVENGANVNVQSKSGITPIVAASASGNIDVVGYLLEKGGKIQ
ncbi:ankyrin repeat domain-containing protein [Candidatus Micrarchaeota archaeon]|nr:ankyrin repeat domain-containing protein [Candidatus Micrarchaeota archaeon]